MQQFEAQQQTFSASAPLLKYTLDAMNVLAAAILSRSFRPQKSSSGSPAHSPSASFPDGDLTNPFAATASPLRMSSARPAACRHRSPGRRRHPFHRRPRPLRNPSRGCLQLRHQAQKPRHFLHKAKSRVLPADRRRALHHARDGRRNRRPRLHQHQRPPSEAVAAAINGGSNYLHPHLLPTPSRNATAHFRKIQVRLQQQGYNLSLRQNCYHMPSTPTLPSSPPKSKSTQPHFPPNPKTPLPPRSTPIPCRRSQWSHTAALTPHR